MSTCFSKQIVADEWFNAIAGYKQLPAEIVEQLDVDGLVTIPGPISSNQMSRIAAAYDQAVANADPSDVSHGSTTTRVHDFVNRTVEFDEFYIYPKLLEACCHTINQPFKLSTMVARTVRRHVSAQTLHVDFPRDADGWPMVGFIFMADDFRADNGATRFVPGSHKWSSVPKNLEQVALDCSSQRAACGFAHHLQRICLTWARGKRN